MIEEILFNFHLSLLFSLYKTLGYKLLFYANLVFMKNQYTIILIHMFCLFKYFAVSFFSTRGSGTAVGPRQRVYDTTCGMVCCRRTSRGQRSVYVHNCLPTANIVHVFLGAFLYRNGPDYRNGLPEWTFICVLEYFSFGF